MSGSGRGKTVTVLLAVSAICGMLGLTAASVPLYRLFCQVTGYGGTTQVAEALPAAPLAQTIKVRFNADVDPTLPWSFRPVQREVEVQLGEQQLAFFRARNQLRPGDRRPGGLQRHAVQGRRLFRQDRLLLLRPSSASRRARRSTCRCRSSSTRRSSTIPTRGT